MQAPEPDNAALAYLRAGASIIPLAYHEKRPWAALLPEGRWATYQRTRATEAEVRTWLRVADQPPNWGVVCGQISGGLYCGDCDDLEFSRWILEHARDPLFRGACIVRSGSGKAHVWFRSQNPVYSGNWRPGPRAKKVGDIRGDGSGDAGGSYMVVPPSIHPDTGEPYERVSGSFTTLPDVDNGDAFLQSIVGAYLADQPGGAPPPPNSNDKHSLLLTGDDQIRVVRHVHGLRLKKRIEDTILRPGNQDPGSKHWSWTAVSSHSEVDWAVVCELIRKNQTFTQVEEIFAATPIGDNCYRNPSRGNHGYSYLKLTYDGAQKEVERERQQARVAAGTNFKVVHVRRTVFERDHSLYRLTVECTLQDGSAQTYEVDLDDEDVLSLERTVRAFSKQTQFVPAFANNQQGRHFAGSFGQAVMGSVNETVGVLEAHTRYGFLASVVRRAIHSLPEGFPVDVGHAHGLGWHVGDTYYLRALNLNPLLRGHDHTFKAEDARRVLDSLSRTWEQERHRWPDGRSEEIVKLVLDPRA